MIPTRLLAFFFLSLLWIPCTISVTVTTSRPKVEVHENTNAVLTCEFQTERETNPRIEWKKKGKEVSYIYFDGEFKGSFKDRASINLATVTLYGVSVKDSGLYICEVTARHDKILLGEVTISLSVLVPSHTPSCEVPETAVSGSAVKLHCEDKLNVPPVNYSWYKDNKPLITTLASSINYSLDGSGTLKFKSVSQPDAGQYRCEASNGVRPPSTCVGQHMTITESESNLPLVTIVGAALVILSCSLAVCLCCQKSCCHHVEKKTGKHKRNMNNCSSPTNPKHFKHTQSFMV